MFSVQVLRAELRLLRSNCFVDLLGLRVSNQLRGDWLFLFTDFYFLLDDLYFLFDHFFFLVLYFIRSGISFPEFFAHFHQHQSELILSGLITTNAPKLVLSVVVDDILCTSADKLLTEALILLELEQ